MHHKENIKPIINYNLFTDKINYLGNKLKVKGNALKLELLREEMRQISKLSGVVKKLHADLNKPFTEENKVLAPHIKSLYEVSANIIADMLKNNKTTNQSNEEIALVSTALKQANNLLINPNNFTALEKLTKCNTRLAKITKDQEKWRIFKSRLLKATGIAWLVFAVMNSLTAPNILAVDAAEAKLISGIKLGQPSSKEKNTKALINAMNTLTNTLPFALPISKPSITNTELVSLQETLAVVKEDLEKDRQFKNKQSNKRYDAARLFAYQKETPEERKAIYPCMHALYETGNKLAQKLEEQNAHEDIKLLNQIFSTAEEILEEHAEYKNIQNLNTLIDAAKQKTEPEWKTLANELEKTKEKIHSLTIHYRK